MMIRASLAAVVLVAIAGSAAVSANDDDMAVTSGIWLCRDCGHVMHHYRVWVFGFFPSAKDI